MSVRKNVGFGLLMRGVAKAEIGRRVEEAIGLVRLQGQENKLPGQLSGGQQQRVAIARAIAVEPPVVLMDEPLSNLDASLRLEMRAEIRRIHNTLGATTVYVTHDQEEALSLADRIVVMRDGAVRQVGAPEDLYGKPDHLDVAAFMGFRNRVRGRVAALDGERATLDVNGTTLAGRVREAVAVGDPAVATVRPDDLHPVEGDGLSATVVSTEFRGREFLGLARTPDGVDLSFRSPERLPPGSPITLGADPERVLVYPGGVS
jgi:putative spermidine/putrescine transport system ATP-binding protein